jgi:hypothetical protein
VLLLSTALFVIETGKDVPTVDTNQNNVFYTYRQSTRTTLISALANATDGGNQNILSTDLNELKTVILANSYEAMLTVDCNTLNSSSYHNGLWISWGANGQGVSSAYATFAFAASSPSASSNLEYALNVTSEVRLNGNYQQLTNTTKQVHLTFTVFNEGKAALTQNFAISYQDATNWIPVASPSTTNFGNGTYTASFITETPQSNDPLIVSLLCQDERGIFVGANVTCTGI